MNNFTDIITFSEVGESGINEDAYFASPTQLLVLDGASGLDIKQVTKEDSDAKWLAQHGASLLGELLSNKKSEISSLCRIAAEDIGRRYRIMLSDVDKPEIYPSAGLAALRLCENRMEYYGLGDLTTLIFFKNGDLEIVHDERLTNLDTLVLEEMVRLANENEESVALQLPKIRCLLKKNRMLMNQVGGYPIFDPTARGAESGIALHWDANEVDKVAILSDGMADAVTQYKMADDYRTFFSLIERVGVEEVCFRLRMLQHEDPEFDRFPRFKMGDDATLVTAKIRNTQRT